MEDLGGATLTIALVFFVHILLFRLVLALSLLLPTLLLAVLLARLPGLTTLAMLSGLSALPVLTPLLAFLFHIFIFHVVSHSISS
jgi:hypothetical protein